METSVLNNYKKAAAVWKSAITLAQKKAKEGVLLFDIAEEVEKFIADEGAAPAFPINLSLNEEAAHFTPKWNDVTILKKSDLLKIDIGVHVEGYICDGAVTVNLDNAHAKQIEANELALANAISVVSFGKPVEKIGAEIERTLKEKGFNPVYNLGGHGLGKYDIHSSPSIPNHARGSSQNLEEGAIAIEPFASTGRGNVMESQQVEIFSIEKKFGVRNPFARKLIELSKDFDKLPFAERWLRRKTDAAKLEDYQVTVGLKELMKAGCFHTYPGLRESVGSLVTQVEKSLLVLEDKTIVLGE
ncbi:Methionine aminopeptidase [uncultured archaeon]|nr:Methionine aminopeptidase [uncultured archaeon]